MYIRSIVRFLNKWFKATEPKANLRKISFRTALFQLML